MQVNNTQEIAVFLSTPAIRAFSVIFIITPLPYSWFVLSWIPEGGECREMKGMVQ